LPRIAFGVELGAASALALGWVVDLGGQADLGGLLDRNIPAGVSSGNGAF
jgi:hypothetical protein